MNRVHTKRVFPDLTERGEVNRREWGLIRTESTLAARSDDAASATGEERP